MTGCTSILVNPQPADLSRLLNRLHHAEQLAESRKATLDGAMDMCAILSQRIVRADAQLAALHDLLAPADDVAGALRLGAAGYAFEARARLLALADWIAPEVPT